MALPPIPDTPGSAAEAGSESPFAVTERVRALLVWALLAVIAGLAVLSYAWGIAHAPLEPYYAASVRSMSMSWHNFFFGSFDPAGTITLDKLPGAFWLQALSVRVFGYHPWAMVLPQVIAGLLAVVFLFRAVERLMGAASGLIAALVLAVSPATVALNRGNIADTTMVLFLVLAADAVSSAMVSGRQRSLVLAGVWVGLAFQTKMVEAWLVLPAMGLAYLLGSSVPLRRRLRQLLVGGLVAIALSLLWMTVVSLIPAGSRPYVDGSQHNSLFEQVFVYNGFGRFGQQTPVQLLFGNGLGGLGGLAKLVLGPAPSWHRLLTGDLGRDTGLLLPAALAIGIAGLFTRRRSFYVLWVGWLLTLAVVFSFGSTINAYYTAALSPPIAAILGGGIVSAWTWWWRAQSAETSTRSRWTRLAPLLVLAIMAGTLADQLWLADQHGTAVPGWLAPLVIAAGSLAFVLLVASSLPFVGRLALTAAIVVATTAMLVVPASGSALLVNERRSFADTPFESASTADLFGALLASSGSGIGAAGKGLERLQLGAPYLMAVDTSAVASEFIDATGKEVLPIGGFTGAIPEPTLGQLESDIRAGKFHLVLLLGKSHDPRLVWIATHCRPLGPGGFGIYLCSPADAPIAR